MGKTDVFISHSHKDKAIADTICHHFEQAKIKCWIAPRDISPGATWSHSIADAIPECKIMLLIFSSSSNMSDQVLREVELSVSEKLIIVPVKIEDIMPTGGMKYYLSTVHWIDAVNKKTEKYIISLTETVKGLLSNETKMPLLEKNEVKKKINSLLIWVPSVAIITLLALGFIFKDNIFKNSDLSMAAEATAIIATEESTATIAPTSEPTPSPTVEPTPSPTATIASDIALDTVVEIPDIVLKSCLLKTLDNMGYPAEGNIITVADMQRIEVIAVTSVKDEIEYILGSVRVYTSKEKSVLVSDVGIETLEGLQYAKNLKLLILRGQNLKDISALSQIHNLECVDFVGNSIEDITALASHANIDTMDVSGNSISDISPLMPLYNLRELYIGGNPINEITPIKGLFSLTVLDISGLQLDSLEALSKLENLTFLSASGVRVQDMADLQNLTNLIDLTLENCNIAKIDFINTMVNLDCLNIRGNSIVNPSELLKLPELEYLWIDETIVEENPEIFDELIRSGCKVNEN